MATKFTGVQNVPLSIGVFLAADKYDYQPNPQAISATSLMRSIRQLVLTRRADAEFLEADLGAMVASRIGTAIHDGIEDSWKNHYKSAMLAMGYPQRVIDAIVINPENPDELTEDDFPIYLENRQSKKVGNYWINGKYDIVLNGRVEDFKTTSVFSYINGTNDKKHRLQLSIYRWLNPSIVTEPQGAIQYIFTDWQAMRAKTEAAYPKARYAERIVDLMSHNEVQAYVEAKIADYERCKDLPETSLPECNDEDLWRRPPEWKYYKNPEKTARSTKNFDNLHDARKRLADDGHVGIVVEVPGAAVACKYCPAFNLCSQKDKLIADGDLILE